MTSDTLSNPSRSLLPSKQSGNCSLAVSIASISPSNPPSTNAAVHKSTSCVSEVSKVLIVASDLSSSLSSASL
ncbi:hypothetical protein, partial [Staphylococcus aureus]